MRPALPAGGRGPSHARQALPSAMPAPTPAALFPIRTVARAPPEVAPSPAIPPLTRRIALKSGLKFL